MIEFREFDKNDWYGNAGATAAPDGRQPLIASSLDDDGASHPYEILVDAVGIEVRLFKVDEEGEFSGFDCWHFMSESYDANVAVAKALDKMDSAELERFGFVFQDYISW